MQAVPSEILMLIGLLVTIQGLYTICVSVELVIEKFRISIRVPCFYTLGNVVPFPLIDSTVQVLNNLFNYLLSLTTLILYILYTAENFLNVYLCSVYREVRYNLLDKLTSHFLWQALT